MLVGIASDHRGVQLKKVLIDHFKDFKDYGTMNEESTDYPIYAFKIGEEIWTKEVLSKNLFQQLNQNLKKRIPRIITVRMGLIFIQMSAMLIHGSKNTKKF